MTTAHAITPLPQTPANTAPLDDAPMEAALLGSLLLGTSPTEFMRFSHLTEEHFYGERHKRLWVIMKALILDGLTIDLNTVKSRFKAITPEGEAFLLTILAHAGDNPVDYARMLQLIEWRRDVDQQLKAAWLMNGNRKMSAEAVATVINRTATELQIKASLLIGPMSHPGAALARELSASYASEDRSSVGISTGYRDLDAALNGFEKSRVYLFGAGTGVGKSILLQNLARRLQRNKQRGLFISLEMSVKEYGLRAVSSEAGIDVNLIKQHTMTDHQTRRFYESLQRMADDPTPLHYVYMSLPTIEQLKSKILELYHAQGIDFVCIDYVDSKALTPTDKAHIANPVTFLGALAILFEKLAKDLNIFFLNVAQVNRASQQRGGRPQITDFAGASALEQKADVAAILQDVDDITSDDYGAVYMYVLKVRTGAKEVLVKLSPRKETFTFLDWQGN